MNELDKAEYRKHELVGASQGLGVARQTPTLGGALDLTKSNRERLSAIVSQLEDCNARLSGNTPVPSTDIEGAGNLVGGIVPELNEAQEEVHREITEIERLVALIGHNL